MLGETLLLGSTQPPQKPQPRRLARLAVARKSEIFGMTRIFDSRTTRRSPLRTTRRPVLTAACFALAAAPFIPTQPHSTAGRRSGLPAVAGCRAATPEVPFARLTAPQPHTSPTSQPAGRRKPLGDRLAAPSRAPVSSYKSTIAAYIESCDDDPGCGGQLNRNRYRAPRPTRRAADREQRERRAGAVRALQEPVRFDCRSSGSATGRKSCIVTVETAVFLIDTVQHLQTARHRAAFRFRTRHHRTRNAVERIVRE